MVLASAHRKLLIYSMYFYWEFKCKPNRDASQAVLFNFLV
jgi:hypothetical protein